jgi:hypothetical protein
MTKPRNMGQPMGAGSSPPTESPIFLTGFARSGTTWVNRLMRDYFDAGFVNEGQFIVAFGLRLSRYGDLCQQENFRRLLLDLRRDEFFSILKRNYSVTIDWYRLEKGPTNFTAVTLDILHQIAEQMGKSRIGSKYPVFGRHLDLLNRFFPACRIIHVIRDGRDCAMSHRHVTWGHQNTCAAAVHWRKYIKVTRNAAQDMPGRYLEIRYEDLISDPKTTMAELEHFVTGAPAGPVTARFMSDAKQLKPEKIARWREAMSLRDQAIFDGVAADMLESCGYPLTGMGRPPSAFRRGWYATHDRLSREAWHLARKMISTIPETK